MPFWWGTGTPFLFPKAQIPSCADPHRIIHITSLPPRGGGTICDCSSQPKLPYLEFWDSLHGWRRDSPPFHQRGDILPMECLLKDTSKVPLFLCPAQLSDALHKSLGLFSASPTICYQHFPMKTPSYYTATAALPRGRCRILTEHKPSSTVAFLTSLQPKQPQWKEEKHPNACSREPCTQILLPPLQLGGVRSPGLGQA